MSLRGWSFGWGELLTLVAASLYAAHILALGRWSRANIAYVLAVVQLATMGLAFLAVASVGGMQLPQGRDVPAFLYLAILAGGVALLAQTWAQAHLPAATVSVIMVLEPVWAGVIGVSIFGEQLTFRIVLGGALILLALMAITGRRPRAGALDIRARRWRWAPFGSPTAGPPLADVVAGPDEAGEDDGQDHVGDATHEARDRGRTVESA